MRLRRHQGIKEALTSGAELKKSLQDMTEQVKTDFKDAVDVPAAEPTVNEPAKNVPVETEEKGKTEKVTEQIFQ